MYTFKSELIVINSWKWINSLTPKSDHCLTSPCANIAQSNINSSVPRLSGTFEVDRDNMLFFFNKAAAGLTQSMQENSCGPDPYKDSFMGWILSFISWVIPQPTPSWPLHHRIFTNNFQQRNYSELIHSVLSVHCFRNRQCHDKDVLDWCSCFIRSWLENSLSCHLLWLAQLAVLKNYRNPCWSKNFFCRQRSLMHILVSLMAMLGVVQLLWLSINFTFTSWRNYKESESCWLMRVMKSLQWQTS